MKVGVVPDRDFIAAAVEQTMARSDWRRVGLAATAFCIATGHHCGAPAFDGPASEFSRRYQGVIPKFAHGGANVSCKVSGAITRNGQREQFDAEYYAMGTSRQEIRRYTDTPRERPSGRVVSLSPEMGFYLERPVRDGAYLIKAFDDSASSMVKEQLRVRLLFELDPFLYAATRVFDVPMEDVASGNGVAISSVTQLSPSEGSIEIACAFKPPWKNYKSARVVLDPEWDYAIREYDIVFDSAVEGTRETRHGVVECERWSDADCVFPKTVRIVDETLTPDGKRFEIVREARFEDVRVGSVSEAQFKLDKFGLPNISLRGRDRLYPFNRWYFWSLVATSIVGWLYLRKKSHGQRMGQTEV